MAGFHGVVDEVLIVEGLLEVPIYLHEVGVWDLVDVVQLTAEATGSLCFMCCGGVYGIVHIGSGALEQPCNDCLLILEFLDLCKSCFRLLLQLL